MTPLAVAGHNELPPPGVFGLPSRFTTWRRYQPDAIMRIVDAQRRFVGLVVPTGGGKSLIAMASALLTGGRVLYLTASKGLQSQLLRDFAPLGVVDIRGKGNYPCHAKPEVACADAPCQAGWRCRVRWHCKYWQAVGRARAAQFVVSNYAYWMALPESDADIGRFDLIIADEAHNIDTLVGRGVEVEMGIDLWRHWWPSVLPSTLDGWRDWAKAKRPELVSEAKALGVIVQQSGRWSEKQLRDYKKLRKRAAVLTRVIEEVGDDWLLTQETYVADNNATKTNVRMGPVWTRSYVEDVLWRGVPRAVVMSATLSGKTLRMLGIEATGEDGLPVLAQYPHTFAASNRPFVHVPTVRMNHRTDSEGIRLWARRIRQIVNGRRDRNGILHTVSYQRRDALMRLVGTAMADDGVEIITHANRDTETKVARFKQRRTDPPVLLVSPSVATGWDFPGTECEFQIVGKVPYPDTTNRLVAARCRDDDEYGPYVAMMEMVQMVGRGVRCFSADTQLLTTSGWKGRDEIREGDVVYGIDDCVWDRKKQIYDDGLPLREHRVLAVNRETTPEPLLRIAAKSVDLQVTPDHTMVVQTIKRSVRKRRCRKPYGKGVYDYDVVRIKRSEGLVKMKACDLPARFRLPVSGRIQRMGVRIGGGVVAAQDWMRLMGLIISDGSISPTQSTVTIYQSKPHNLDYIDRLVRRLGLNPVVRMAESKGTTMSVGDGAVYTRNHDRFYWVFSGTDAAKIRDVFDNGCRRRHTTIRAYRKKRHRGSWGYDWVDGWKEVEKTIPRWVMARCSTRQLRALMEGLLVGDGSWNGKHGCYYTKSRELADLVQEVAVLAGYRSGILERRGQFEVGLSDNCFVSCIRNTAVSVGDTGVTWCVNTELGTVVARRVGKTFIAGNSQYDRCQTLVVDDNIVWFMQRYRHLAPDWFAEAYSRSPSIPEPLPKITGMKGVMGC